MPTINGSVYNSCNPQFVPFFVSFFYSLVLNIYRNFRSHISIDFWNNFPIIQVSLPNSTTGLITIFIFLSLFVFFLNMAFWNTFLSHSIHFIYIHSLATLLDQLLLLDAVCLTFVLVLIARSSADAKLRSFLSYNNLSLLIFVCSNIFFSSILFDIDDRGPSCLITVLATLVSEVHRKTLTSFSILFCVFLTEPIFYDSLKL